MARGVAYACVIAGLSACSFRGTPVTGNPSDASGAEHQTDGSQGDGINDSDGDGIADDVDNCITVPNHDQHDEDGDHIGDACDPCPQLAVATTDTDGDGIGEACDPHPGTPGDAMVKFEPFTGSGNLPTGWQSKGGGAVADWKQGNDTLTIAADNATRIAIFDSGSPHHAIDIGFDVVSVTGGGPSLQFVTGLVDVKSDVHEFFGCGIRLDGTPGGKSRELLTFNDPNYVGLATDPTEPPLAPGSYRFVFVTDSTGESCVIPGASSDHRQTSNIAGRGNTFVGLRANNATIAFRYVVVYRF